MKNKKNKKKTNKNVSVNNKKINKENNENNIVKLKTSFKTQNLIQTKKLGIFLIAIILLFVLLVVRIGYIQFVQGSSLKEAAYNQQAINQIISPKRGNIYDSTGRELAISAQVDTITINPRKNCSRRWRTKNKRVKRKSCKRFVRYI